MRKKYLIIAFALMVLVQLAFPLKMIIDREIILAKGETFLFKIRPIDPYDAFRGRYVTISYEDNEVPYPTELQEEKDLEVLYIRVQKGKNGIAHYGKVSKERPSETNSYLIRKEPNVFFFYENNDTLLTGTLQLDLPNRYYMNEGKAPIAETLLRDAYAQVAIYKGETVLKGIWIEGQPIEKYIEKLNRE